MLHRRKSSRNLASFAMITSTRSGEVFLRRPRPSSGRSPERLRNFLPVLRGALRQNSGLCKTGPRSENGFVKSTEKPLPLEDLHLIQAAEGWLGLGNPTEAMVELNK